MKTRNYLLCLLTIIAFGCYTATTYATGVKKKYRVSSNVVAVDELPSQASMSVSSTPDQLIIHFDNPAQELLTIEITNPTGEFAMTYTTLEPMGDIVINIADMVTSDYNNVFQVDLYSGDGKKKVEGGTIVIIRE